MSLLTAAGLYLLWRSVVRPLTRAGYLILKAATLTPVAALRLISGVRLAPLAPEPTGYRLSDHPLDPDDDSRAEGYRHPPKKG